MTVVALSTCASHPGSDRPRIFICLNLSTSADESMNRRPVMARGMRKSRPNHMAAIIVVSQMGREARYSGLESIRLARVGWHNLNLSPVGYHKTARCHGGTVNLSALAEKKTRTLGHAAFNSHVM